MHSADNLRSAQTGLGPGSSSKLRSAGAGSGLSSAAVPVAADVKIANPAASAAAISIEHHYDPKVKQQNFLYEDLIKSVEAAQKSYAAWYQCHAGKYIAWGHGETGQENAKAIVEQLKKCHQLFLYRCDNSVGHLNTKIYLVHIFRSVIKICEGNANDHSFATFLLDE